MHVLYKNLKLGFEIHYNSIYCYNEFQIPILNSYITVTEKKRKKKEKFVTFVS